MRTAIVALLLLAMGCASKGGSEAWIELHAGTGLGELLRVRLDRSGQGRFYSGGQWTSFQLGADDLASIERILNLERFDTLGETLQFAYDANYSIVRVRGAAGFKTVSVHDPHGECSSEELRRYARIWNVLLTLTAPQEATGRDLAWDCAAPPRSSRN